ncbi:MAG TPA: hypothetical protein VLA09_06725, partial [Longimicrobiales bacterium]|nr:hypothetical protein [Longimicrobiales bacterium]
MKRVVKPAYRWVIGRLAGRFIAGPTLDHALAVAARIQADGRKVSLAFWNEIGALPTAVVDSYAAAVKAAAERLSGDAYVSVKLPAAGGDGSVFAEVLALAADCGVRVHFDSHGPEFADERFALLRDALAVRTQPLGATLPGRWRRSLADAAWAVSAGIFVRVVKGEWGAADPADEVDPRAG